MIFKKSGSADSCELNMAAMIDVVMLLLIFFMCTSGFKRPEKILPAAVAASSPDITAETEPVSIKLLTKNGKLSIFCDGALCAGFENLRTKLRKTRALANLDVIITSADSVNFTSVIKAADICRQAGLEKIAFSISKLSNSE